MFFFAGGIVGKISNFDHDKSYFVTPAAQIACVKNTLSSLFFTLFLPHYIVFALANLCLLYLFLRATVNSPYTYCAHMHTKTCQISLPSSLTYHLRGGKIVTMVMTINILL